LFVYAYLFIYFRAIVQPEGATIAKEELAIGIRQISSSQVSEIPQQQTSGRIYQQTGVNTSDFPSIGGLGSSQAQGDYEDFLTRFFDSILDPEQHVVAALKREGVTTWKRFLTLDDELRESLKMKRSGNTWVPLSKSYKLRIQILLEWILGIYSPGDPFTKDPGYYRREDFRFQDILSSLAIREKETGLFCR